MPLIALDHLVAHPGNANRMTPEVFAKLKLHIDRTGDYPPLIVRRNPGDAERFQILDGHHRAKALRELGFDAAQCVVWDVADDRRASLLLLTLNRLHGEDDPRLRGRLLSDLMTQGSVDELAQLLPEDAGEILALIRIAQPPPPDAMPPAPDSALMPQAVTFFLSASQLAGLNARLRKIHHDRSAALVTALRLDDPPVRSTTSNAERPSR